MSSRETAASAVATAPMLSPASSGAAGDAAPLTNQPALKDGEVGAGAMSEKEEKRHTLRFVVVADMDIWAEDEEAACKKFLAEYRDDEAASVVENSWQLDLGVISVGESASDFNAGGRFNIRLPQGGAWVGRPTRERPNELCFMNDDGETRRHTFRAEGEVSGDRRPASGAGKGETAMKHFARKTTLTGTHYEELQHLVEEAIEFARTGDDPHGQVSVESIQLAEEFCNWQNDELHKGA